MRRKSWLICLSLLCFSLTVWADELPFKNNEVLKYDIRYKYGIMMVKGGDAVQSLRVSNNKDAAIKSTLTFKTTSFFDKIYKIRDTLSSQMNYKVQPQYYLRKVNESDTKYKEETFFEAFGKSHSKARVLRVGQSGQVKLDTLHVADNYAFDFLSIFTYIRTLDIASLPLGSTQNLSIFAGKRKINIIIRFQGQAIIERNDYLKYKTYKLELDIVDEIFNESKNAIEVWISDDRNQIPIKIKAKLKIGAAEIDLKSHENLKYPFSAEIKIPR